MINYFERGILMTPTPFSREALMFLGGLALSTTVQAASFDCGKATVKIERLICTDTALSRLDEELAAAYKTALQNENRAVSIRQTQKQWMKERNGCNDAVCVKRQYEMRLDELALRTPLLSIKEVGNATLSSTTVSSGPLITRQEHPEFSTEAEKLKAIRDAIIHRKWVPFLPPDPEYCAKFLDDFIHGGHIRAVEPDVRADSEDDPGLNVWHSCDNVSVDDMKIDDPRQGYDGIFLLGGPPFRYYHIDLDGNKKNGKEDLLYAESLRQEGINYGDTGYTWVDLKGCRIRGGAVVDTAFSQYAPSSLYNLNLVAIYRGAVIVLNIYPTNWVSKPAAYSLQLTRLDNRQPRVCGWRTQQLPVD